MICKERGKIHSPSWLETTWEAPVLLQNSVSILPCRWRLCSGHSLNSKQWVFWQLQRWPVVIWAGDGSPWAGIVGGWGANKELVMVNRSGEMKGGAPKTGSPPPSTASLPKMLSLMTLTWARKANSWLLTSISHTGIFSVFYRFIFIIISKAGKWFKNIWTAENMSIENQCISTPSNSQGHPQAWTLFILFLYMLSEFACIYENI